jgi:hypothetical protein
VIDLREIDETIDQLKRKGDTIQAAERLAMMYIVREYMLREIDAQNVQGYSQAADKPVRADAPKVIKTGGESAFLAACDGARVEDVLMLMDEHMGAIKLLYPREHDTIVRRLEEMKKGG